MKLVLATRNSGKLAELQKMLAGTSIEIFSAASFPDCPESDEPYATYLENARDKAQVVAKHCDTWALADDSGLEVDALQGRPGVYSARYAGENVTYEDNYRKILQEMEGVKNRAACFRCCMVLYHPSGEEFITEGRLEGEITQEALGENGFGYDPIFYLPMLGKTLAQLSSTEKNTLSHRTQALEQMRVHLQACTQLALK